MDPNLDPELESSANLIHEKLFSCGDIESMVLKGHLLTEYFLDKLIEKGTLNGSRYNSKSFNYVKKIEIIKFISFSLPNEIVEGLLKLNSLRNHIAHTLDYDLKDVQSFIDKIAQIKKSKEEEENKSLELALKYSIVYLCGMIDSAAIISGKLNEYLLKHIADVKATYKES